MNDVDGNDNGRHRGSQLGDNGVKVRADADVVVVVMKEDLGGRGRRHMAWIEQQ